MASWILVPCLTSLRGEFDELAPQRDRRSDGTIGDAAHQQTSSDHNPDETGKTPYEDADHINEVHAIDIDSDLNEPGITMQQCCDVIRLRHKAGVDDRLRYIIFNRRIASVSGGWVWEPYSGVSPHTEHAHFSCKYTTAQESDTRPWGLLEELGDGMASISQADFNSRMDAWWLARMGSQAPVNVYRQALESAPWHQPVGHSEISTHDYLFGVMKTELDVMKGQLTELAAAVARLGPPVVK